MNNHLEYKPMPPYHRILALKKTSYRFLVRSLGIFGLSCSLLNSNAMSYEIKHREPAIRQADEKLWHQRDPVWQKYCLPIGNGKIGAMVYGGVEQERINFTIDSLWSGRVRPDQNVANTHQKMARARELILDGKYSEAEDLCQASIGCSDGVSDDFGSFGTFGDLIFHTGIPYEKVSNFERRIELDKALSIVEFDYQGHHYQRTAFVSHPDQCMVVKFETSEGAKQNINLSFQSPNTGLSVTTEGQDMIISGVLQDNDLPLSARVRVQHEGGKLSSGTTSLKVSDAQSITFFLTANTGYDLSQENRIGPSRNQEVLQTMNRASSQAYSSLLKRHLHDHHSLFNRVSVDFGESSPKQKSLCTKERIKAYRINGNDPDLMETLYQFGRYLLIASSRSGTLPANLQGVWNNSPTPAWNGDYHINVNLQMNYWLAGPTNLIECEEPLLEFIDSLVKPGTETAKAYFDADGWMSYHATNIWGHTAPRVARNEGQLTWKALPTCSLWIAHHLYEHFAYCQDKLQLAQQLWPSLKEAANFASTYLYKLPEGYYTSMPSWSSEHGSVSKGPITDIAITREILKCAIECAEILGEHGSKIELWKKRLDLLLPYKVGQHGQLQEWYEDRDDPNNRHRHINHLWGLYPGTQISPLNTPTKSKAAAITLKHRGDKASGWSLGWKLNFWARMRNGDKAYQLVDDFIKGRLYPNLFDICPPFQIDGNFGATSGMTEMLMQSQDRDKEGRHIIDILPALPSSWPTGSAKGLVARGNHEVDIQWQQGQLKTLRVTSRSGHAFALRTPGVNEIRTFSPKKDETVIIHH